MPHTEANTPVATAYARSLLELANEQQQAEAIGQEMRGIAQLSADNEGFALYLANPGVSEADRRAMLERIFKGRASPLVMNFLGVVQAKGRLPLLGQIADAYQNLLDLQLGNVEVDVTVAQTLSEPQQQELRSRIAGALGKNVVMHQHVDPQIIGGMVLRVQDRLIDASVRMQIDAMREKILSARPR